jgi:hypothetical protein
MKKLLVFSMVLLSIVSCQQQAVVVNPNLIYDTLSVSKLVDSVIKQTPNLKGNEANQNEVINKIMFNNFYTIYNNVPMKFYDMDEGTYVEETKKTYYYVSFYNQFKTKNNNKLSINVAVLMEEKDAKTLIKDSLYTLTGDFNKFQNEEFKGSISVGDGDDRYTEWDSDYQYEINFPITYLKNHNNKFIPFTFRKITK